MGYLKFNKESYYNSLNSALNSGNKETFRTLFLRLHDRDQSDAFRELTADNKRKIAEYVEPLEFRDIFRMMEVEDQEAAIEHLPYQYIKDVMAQMPNDSIAYFINRSNQTKKEWVLKYLDSAKQREVLEILSYASETAGSIMTKECAVVLEHQTVEQVIEYLREIGEYAETIYYVYIVDEHHRLTGVTSLRDILMSSTDTLMKDIMIQQIVSAHVSDDQEDVLQTMKDYDLLAIPVVSEDNLMQGIITVDDMIDIMEEESTEDFHEFAGIRKQDMTDETGQKKSIIQTAFSRTPWLAIFMLIAMAIGGLTNLFEDTLQQAVLLSAFIPAIMDTAGNVGTQSLAVTISEKNLTGMTFTELLKTLRVEILAGIYMGVTSAAMMFVVINIFYRDMAIAAVVSLSLIITIVVSTILGVIIPLIVDKLGFDISVASGPFITIFADAIGLFLYFSIATILI